MQKCNTYKWRPRFSAVLQEHWAQLGMRGYVCVTKCWICASLVPNCTQPRAPWPHSSTQGSAGQKDAPAPHEGLQKAWYKSVNKMTDFAMNYIKII